MYLSKILAPFARRFVAGETSADAVNAARAVNARGMGAILDFLGEDVKSPQEAAAAADEYVTLLGQAQAAGIRAGVSLKVSQMGLLLSQEICLDTIRRVLTEAARYDRDVWLDMEGSPLTQKTIDIFEELRGPFPRLGLCLQAYLVRTGGDVDRLMRRPLRLRLCKGAYKEPASIAFSTQSAVDGNYRMLVEKVLERGGGQVYAGFATHDETLVQFVLQKAAERNIRPEEFEFQMLYGIRNNRLQALVADGWRTQVYIPYGKAWLPYFLRRLRERKENLIFLTKNLFQK